jgi:hypothetical protein
MGVKIFDLVFQSHLNWDFIIDVLLGPVDNTNVTELEVNFFI